MRGLALGVVVVWLTLAAPAIAETIYTWTDKDGTKRFSNELPPEGIKVYQTETVSPTNDVDTPAENRRSGYDRMVERATTESGRIEQQRKTAEAAKAAELKRQTEARRQNRIDAQRKQLERKIEAIKNRALSPTYTKGMQAGQIEKIRQQIKQLNGQSKSNPAQEQESRKSSY